MSTPTKRTTVGLWMLQGLLMFVFVSSGVGKFVMTAEEMAGPVALPLWFLRFIGGAEVLGGVGLLLPAATGITPGLTRLAALGLAAIMVGATATTLMGEPKTLAALPVVVLCLVSYVAYARREIGSR